MPCACVFVMRDTRNRKGTERKIDRTKNRQTRKIDRRGQGDIDRQINRYIDRYMENDREKQHTRTASLCQEK